MSVRDGIDLKTPAGRMLAGMLASVAQFETEIRAERVAAGLANKRKNVTAGRDTWNVGRKPGTPTKLTPEVLTDLYAKLDAEVPVARISRLLKLSRQTIYTAKAAREAA